MLKKDKETFKTSTDFQRPAWYLDNQGDKLPAYKVRSSFPLDGSLRVPPPTPTPPLGCGGRTASRTPLIPRLIFSCVVAVRRVGRGVRSQARPEPPLELYLGSALGVRLGYITTHESAWSLP
jgi:hypothetical protein